MKTVKFKWPLLMAARIISPAYALGLYLKSVNKNLWLANMSII